ncbi:hypothetical protein ACJRO7_028321 [Eucalyptus globulus]|uniref:Uncharacterized protein n=1 Tax=Eucalyptus globulus TaxID=34317 RepID=A0ABD3JZ96_EUCGL
MVREWKEAATGASVGEASSSGAVLVLTAFLLSLALFVVVMFMCADGMSKDKASASDHTGTYGSNCAAGCGAACGG